MRLLFLCGALVCFDVVIGWLVDLSAVWWFCLAVCLFWF